MSDRLAMELEREARDLAIVERLRATVPKAQATFRQIGALAGGLRPVPWLVRRYLERGTSGCWFGEAEAGKSLLLFDMGAHIAANLAWNGHKVAQGAVFYLCAEGAEGLKRRARAWAIRHGVDLDAIPLFARTVTTDLCDPTAALAVGDQVMALADQAGVPPQLVIVDTVSRHMTGDENSSADMAKFVAQVDMLVREPTGAAIAYSHHVGHGDKSRARGSSVLRAAVDVEYRVSRDPESGVVALECTKSKDWARPEARHFRLCPVELGITDDEGEPVVSVVLDPTEAPEAGSREPRARGTNQHKALAVLHRLHREHADRLAADDRDPDTAKVLIEDWRRESGLHRNRWPEALAALTERDMVRLDHPYAIPLGRPK